MKISASLGGPLCPLRELVFDDTLIQGHVQHLWAREALGHRHHGLPEAKKGWLGWDVRKGIEATKGDFIALIDGDGQMPAKDIIRVYEKIRKEDLDLVLTYRKKRGDGLYRFILSNTYNLLTKVLFPGIPFRDMNSKPKIIKRSSLNLLNLSVDNWTIDAEIMLQSWQKKLKIQEIATDFHGQPGGRKSFVGKSSIFQFILFLLRFRIRGY